MWFKYFLVLSSTCCSWQLQPGPGSVWGHTRGYITYCTSSYDQIALRLYRTIAAQASKDNQVLNTCINIGQSDLKYWYKFKTFRSEYTASISDNQVLNTEINFGHVHLKCTYKFKTSTSEIIPLFHRFSTARIWPVNARGGVGPRF